MPVSARVAHHWISDINANSCNEFRMTLHLGLLRGEVLVVPNWYFIFAILKGLLLIRHGMHTGSLCPVLDWLSTGSNHCNKFRLFISLPQTKWYVHGVMASCVKRVGNRIFWYLISSEGDYTKERADNNCKMFGVWLAGHCHCVTTV